MLCNYYRISIEPASKAQARSGAVPALRLRCIYNSKSPVLNINIGHDDLKLEAEKGSSRKRCSHPSCAAARDSSTLHNFLWSQGSFVNSWGRHSWSGSGQTHDTQLPEAAASAMGYSGGWREATAAASAGPWPLGCGASLLSQPQRELLRWLWRAVLRPFWPAPVAALAFALGVRALGYWGSVMPGTQAVFIMCWVQCCFGVLSRQGRRTALRLAQLAAALVGVLVLLPRHSAYSSGELGLRFGVPSGYDEDGGVDGDLPALSAWGAGDWSWGGLLGLLGVDMGSLSGLGRGAGPVVAAGGRGSHLDLPALDGYEALQAAGGLGTVFGRVSRDSDNKRWLYGGPGRSWLAVLALAAAMAAPLPLPDLLRSRHAVLWHTALLLRPAASRPLGLRLLDCNAAKLMTGVAVGLLFASWAAAVFSWQLLQVATLVGGLAKLYLDGVRQQHNGGIGGMVSGGANGCTGAANGHGTLLNGCASSADAPCSPTAAGSSGGSSAELVLSCCSSAYSLHSASITAVSGCEQQGYSGTSSRDVVAACPAPSAGTSGASGSAGGGGGAGGQSWYGGGGVGVGGGAQLARRVLPAASSAPLPAPAAPGHHGVPPLSPGSGLGAGGLDAGAGGLAACHSVTLGATGAAAVLLGVGGANGNGHPHHAYLTPRKVGFADSAAAASGGCQMSPSVYGGASGPMPAPAYAPGYSSPGYSSPSVYSTYPPPAPVYGGNSPVAPTCTTVTGCLTVNASSGGALDAFNLTAQNWVPASRDASNAAAGLLYEFGVAAPLGMSGNLAYTPYRPYSPVPNFVIQGLPVGLVDLYVCVRAAGSASSQLPVGPRACASLRVNISGQVSESQVMDQLSAIAAFTSTIDRPTGTSASVAAIVVAVEVSQRLAAVAALTNSSSFVGNAGNSSTYNSSRASITGLATGLLQDVVDLRTLVISRVSVITAPLASQQVAVEDAEHVVGLLTTILTDGPALVLSSAYGNATNSTSSGDGNMGNSTQMQGVSQAANALLMAVSDSAAYLTRGLINGAPADGTPVSASLNPAVGNLCSSDPTCSSAGLGVAVTIISDPSLLLTSLGGSAAVLAANQSDFMAGSSLVSPLVRVTAPGLPSTASSLNTLLYLDVPVNTSAVAAGGSTAKRVLVRLQDYNLGTADASAGVSASRSTTVTSNSTTAAADGVVSGYSNTLGDFVVIQYNTNGMGQSGGGGAAGQSLPSALLALTSAVGAVLMGALLL
eukprot:XP_001697809.1 predicted protein [Chlamydomonas reinhardtii]